MKIEVFVFLVENEFLREFFRSLGFYIRNLYGYRCIYIYINIKVLGESYRFI